MTEVTTKMNQQNIELVHGFVDKPKAGRWIFICAMLLVVNTIIMPFLFAQGGADHVQRITEEADMGVSPVALGGLNVIIVTAARTASAYFKILFSSSVIGSSICGSFGSGVTSTGSSCSMKHILHGPPQSILSSPWFWIPSEQVGT